MIKLGKILIIGACGQIGTELTVALRQQYGVHSVVATDLHSGDASVIHLNVLDKAALLDLVNKQKIDTIYHLAASLSASAEQQPVRAWELNMQGLLNVLDVARYLGCKVFWPSSIAVFGDHVGKAVCSQHSVTQPKTVYGISKAAGENWCQYYFDQYGVDVRSVRYPGLISSTAKAGGGTTDYAVEAFPAAVAGETYTCYLKSHTPLPMMYMSDAVAAAIRLMESPAEHLTIRTSYNIGAMSFNPSQLEKAIQVHLPAFKMDYAPDFRQAIAESWPFGLDDRYARNEWGWQAEYDLERMTAEMITALNHE
ncbi:MAG TPA: NAD-dependent epimerase/dehydratase family protein [Mucilaginibacter sp.]|nr:NAD-dependent epimerase/dehydratase family protein [Mucilaginibacter sp.]